jgi:hypothetical protein
MAPYSMDLRKRVLKAWDSGLVAAGAALGLCGGFSVSRSP